MKYDFNTVIDRRNDGSSKWETMYKQAREVGIESLPEDIVPFSVADMELPNPPEVLQALRDMLDRRTILGYTIPTEHYKDVVIDWQTRRHGWTPEREWLVLSPGVVPSFFDAVRVVTKPGDGVIIQTPVYYPFFRAITANGRRVVENPLIIEDGEYRIDYEDLERKASDPNTTAILVCSPHNPVGRVWTKEELRKLADICILNNVFMIFDEIHNDLIRPDLIFTDIMKVLTRNEFEQVIVCTAPSKTFNLAGLQCSNIYIPSEKVREGYKAEKAKKGSTGLNCFSYTACVAAYTECDEWLDQLNEHITSNQKELADFFAARMPEITVFSLEGTYLQWLDFRSWGMNAKELERFMRKEAYLFMDEGYVFGKAGEGFERINLACPQSTLKAALERLANARDRLSL